MFDLFTLVSEILEWLLNRPVELIEQTFAYITSILVYWQLKMLISSIDFAWGVARDILDNMGVSTLLAQMYASFNPMALGILNYFRIPEFIDTIMGAYATRFVLDFWRS